jgi:hypothetical protein
MQPRSTARTGDFLPFINIRWRAILFMHDQRGTWEETNAFYIVVVYIVIPSMSRFLIAR